MKFKDAMVDVLRDLFSWLKDQKDKENIEFLILLIGSLAFIFAPVFFTIFLLVFFKVKIASYWLMVCCFDIFWLFYSFKVIMKWGES